MTARKPLKQLKKKPLSSPKARKAVRRPRKPHGEPDPFTLH
jgi:hypothetical protein